MLAQVYLFRARVAEAARDYAKAVRENTRSLELHPKCVTALANRGIAHHMLGDLDKAIVDYTKSIELDPDNAEPLYNRGVAWANKNEVAKALADYNRAITLSPDTCSNYYCNRARAFNLKGDYSKAVADITRCLEMSPNRQDALEVRAWSYDQLGQTDKANADRQTLQRLRQQP